MEELKSQSILGRMTAKKRPILELLKEHQARFDTEQQARDAGDYEGGGEFGSTAASRRADVEASEPGMNEGNVGADENLTQKILNFLRKKKLSPRGPGQEQGQGRPVVMPKSPLPQPDLSL